MADEGGQLGYASDKIYAKLLTDFNEAYPEEDYDETQPWQNGNSRSQDHPTIYRPNGALYGGWTKKLKENKNYYVGKTKGYFMPRNRSIDIDTQFEFDLAEFMIKK